MKTYKVVMAVALSLGVLGLTLAEDKKEEKPKFTIKEVMKEAHKNKLRDKVCEGKADKEEKEKLIALYTALHDNVPPQGEKDAWKKKTQDILDAAKEVVKDDKDKAAITKLKKATECAACHGVFRPK
jgi:hypothetical protein